MSERKHLGKMDKDVIIPVPPKEDELGDAYGDFIRQIKGEIKTQRLSIVLNANHDMVMLYWRLGKRILEKQKNEGWGSRVIDRMSFDLQKGFPDMKGFSPRNIKYMRKFAETWPEEPIVQRLVAQLPWGTNIVLIDKLHSNEERVWYAQRTLANGWSRSVLSFQIETNLIKRVDKTVNNFEMALPAHGSDMARQIFKDPYLFDFLGTDAPRREAEMERKLTEHIQEFLLELGQGFAFVGRQVHLEVGGDDFYIDLLFYHLKLRCYIVIELKACNFEPGFVSQLNMYQNAVNRILKHPDDNPTIGLLLVKGKNETVVKYSLEGYSNPIGVADWKVQLDHELTKDIRASLPTIEEIEKELNGDDE